ncbi:hypothetical protein RND81_06G090700 [Saponaria officinalis]|uniref:DUF8039 domain-containing protein n=1 Tax=Saponaria officinalis TaxID=3572 RepID=A0AAW1K9Q8_SAPOF
MSRSDASSSDDSDVEKSNREDERGRTVLAKVGQAIRNGTKIPLDWHPIRRTPCGVNRLTFTRYIGVVVRERVCITYSNWKDVPKTLLEDLYNSIAEISEDSRRRSNLKISSYRGGCLGYQYYEDEIVNELLKEGKHVDEVPRHELWIRAHSRVKNGVTTFNNMTDYETAEIIGALKGKLAQGEIMLEGGRDDILAKALNKPEHGGRVRGIGAGITNREYFGFCRPTPPSQMHAELNGLRSEVTMMKNNQQHIMTFMMSCLSQEQIMQFMAGFNMGSFGGQGGGGQFCYNGGHINDLNGFINGHQPDNIGGQFGVLNGHVNSEFGAKSGQKNGFFTELLNNGDDGFVQWSKGGDGFSQCSKNLFNPSSMLRNQHQDQGKEREQEHDPYFILRSDDKVVRTDHHAEINIQKPNSCLSPTHPDYDSPISEHVLPQGVYHCLLAIEKDKGIQIVASGQVHIPGATEVTLNHFKTLSHEYRRVSVTEDIVPTAPLPCPNEECNVVCQAKYSFVSWPARLIFPKKKLDKQPANVAVSQSPSSQTSTNRLNEINGKGVAKCPLQSEDSQDCGYYICRYIIETISSRRPFIPDEYFHGISKKTYSQELIDELRDMWVKYFFQQIEDEDIEDDDNMDVRQA